MREREHTIKIRPPAEVAERGVECGRIIDGTVWRRMIVYLVDSPYSELRDGRLGGISRRSDEITDGMDFNF